MFFRLTGTFGKSKSCWYLNVKNYNLNKKKLWDSGIIMPWPCQLVVPLHIDDISSQYDPTKPVPQKLNRHPSVTHPQKLPSFRTKTPMDHRKVPWTEQVTAPTWVFFGDASRDAGRGRFLVYKSWKPLSPKKKSAFLPKELWIFWWCWF